MIMRKLISALSLLLLSLSLISAASISGGIPIREDLFWSEEELKNIDFSAPLSNSEREYYENTHIYLVTASPSEPVYIYFGHAGIAIETPDMPEVMFDYGSFRFDESFYMNFIFGRLYYTIIESYSSYRYDSFIAEDRTVEKLELMISPEAKKAVIGFLSYNILPENSTYLYHYYNDNCATRLRDIYNAATGGEFRKWAENIDTGKSFRAWSTPYMHPSLFFAFILNYLQGPNVDKPVTLYDACFLPDILLSSIEEFEKASAETMYETQTREATPETYSLTLRSIGIAAVFSVLILLTATKYRLLRIIGDITAGFIWLLMGLLSVVLLFMMVATNHNVTYGNWNVMIISPFVLILAFLHFSSLGRKEKRKSIGRISRLMLIVSSTMLVLKGCLMDMMIQDNLAYYIFAISAYASEYAVSVLSASRLAPSMRQEYVLGQ